MEKFQALLHRREAMRPEFRTAENILPGFYIRSHAGGQKLRETLQSGQDFLAIKNRLVVMDAQFESHLGPGLSRLDKAQGLYVAFISHPGSNRWPIPIFRIDDVIRKADMRLVFCAGGKRGQEFMLILQTVKYLARNNAIIKLGDCFRRNKRLQACNR